MHRPVPLNYRVKMERISKTAHSIDDTMAENRSKVSNTSFEIVTYMFTIMKLVMSAPTLISTLSNLNLLSLG
jgi:hypothetical protein